MSEHQCSEAERVRWTRWLTGAFLLLLIGSTWRLWTSHENVPAVPMFAWLAAVPPAIDWLLLALVIASCAVWAASKRYAVLVARLLLISLALLLMLDQLRWQPWALQAWLFVAVLTLARPPVALRLLRWLVIGIYFHSAIAKLDYEFAHTLGQQFLGTLLGFVGVQLEKIPANVRLPLALAFPIVELIVALLLCFRRTVRLGVIAAVVMHASAMMVLGPWGLGHQWGVLIWNLWLAMQVPLLFWPVRESLSQPLSGMAENRVGRRVATFLVVAAVLLPFTTRYGWWDTWPSWGLYAPGAERATVYVHELGVVRLPPTLAPHVRGEETWRELQLDRWVLVELQAPLYPQNRVHLALASAIADRHQLGELLRVELDSPANRWTGERENRLLENQRDIASQLKTHWLNALAVR